MNLKQIADDMKQRAVAQPDTAVEPAQPLRHGARLRLKYNAAQYEFRLQVQRRGEMPHPENRHFRAWENELKTFLRDFGAPADALVEYQQGETTYAAVLIWLNEEAMTADYAKWAEGIHRADPAPRIEIDPNDPIAVRFGILPPAIHPPSISRGAP